MGAARGRRRSGDHGASGPQRGTARPARGYRDPYLREVGRDQALVVRVGFGAGDDVADGRWIDAHEAAPAKAVRRRAALSPQERLAALLGRKETALACEELTLRARADLDAGRTARRRCSCGSRWRRRSRSSETAAPTIANRVADLRERQPAVVKAAAAALAGDLSEEQTEAVTETLQRLEAALRART